MRKILVLTLCMAIAMSQSTFAYVSAAKSPSDEGKTIAELNGYSEEQWARLMDNNLEYDEIDDLVKNFNINISFAREKFNENVDNLGASIDTFKAAKRNMESLENSAKNSGDIANMMLYKAQGRGLEISIQAIGIAKEKLSREITSANTPIRRAQAQVSAGVRSMMIGYKTMESNEKMLTEMVKMYEETLSATGQSKNLGLMTATDVTKAVSDLSNARANLLSLTAAKDSLYKNLIMMCGWQPDATVVIGEVPAVSEDELNSLNPGEDIKAAIGNNETLINNRHDTSSRSTAAVDAKLYKSAQDEDMLLINLNGMYDKIQSDKKALEAAKAGAEAARLTENTLETRKNLGMVAGAQYLGERLGIMQKQAEYDAAVLELRTDYNNYIQAVEGNTGLE